MSQSLPLIRNRTREEEVGEASEETEEYLGEEISEEESVAVERKEAEVRQNFRQFLREKGFSAELIKILSNVGLTDEFIRLLTALGLDTEDITQLRELWQIELDSRTDSATSAASLSDKNLSWDGIYLKNAVGKPLVTALKEILQRKPFDPVEYLGHRLLHYKVCEEKERRRREFQLELLMERERIKMQKGEEVATSGTSERGEEEFLEDWDYLNYDSL